MNQWYVIDIWVVKLTSDSFSREYRKNDQRFFKKEQDAIVYLSYMDKCDPLSERKIVRKVAICNAITNSVYKLGTTLDFQGELGG